MSCLGYRAPGRVGLSSPDGVDPFQTLPSLKENDHHHHHHHRHRHHGDNDDGNGGGGDVDDDSGGGEVDMVISYGIMRYTILLFCNMISCKMSPPQNISLGHPFVLIFLFYCLLLFEFHLFIFVMSYC